MSALKFIDFVLFYGLGNCRSRCGLYDLALYHSDVVIGVEEKRALFGVRCLWEGVDGYNIKGCLLTAFYDVF